MAGDERVIAEFSDYDGLLAALRTRVQQLQINGTRFDEFAGLPTGYLSKLIGAAPVRKLGMVSMGPVMNALGLRLRAVEDAAATERLKSRVKPNNTSFRRTVYTLHTLTDRKWAEIQKIGRQARWEKLSKQQRSAIMRAVRAGKKVAIARWRKEP
jgi:hypothetical protein